jgi:hypothetical protein
VVPFSYINRQLLIGGLLVPKYEKNTNEDAVAVVDLINEKQALNMASRVDTARAAVTALNALEKYAPRVQVMAVAALFYLLLRGAKLRHDDVLGYINNMAVDQTHPERLIPQFAGVLDYYNTWLIDRSMI